jgi:hypothetical protein
MDAVLNVIGSNAKTKQLAMRAKMAFNSYIKEKYDAGRPMVSGYGVSIDSEYR